jgi:outer membrane usher protein
MVEPRDWTGKLLGAGLSGRIEGTNAKFVAGYAGEAQIAGLSGIDNVSVEFGQACHAAFARKREPGTRAATRNVVCQ